MPLEDEDFLRDSRLAVLEKTFVSVMDGSVFFSVFFSDRLVSLPVKIYRENLKNIKQALTLKLHTGLKLRVHTKKLTPKHMLWVLKRTVSMRRFFLAPKTYVKTNG